MESKRKMKKSVIFIVIALILVIGGLVGGIVYKNYRDDKLAKEKAQRKAAEEKEILDTMKANYSNYVIIDKASKLYKLDNDKYIEIGEVSSNTTLELEEIKNITLDNQYFKLANSNYYISYKDVAVGEEQSTNANYKHYIPFDNDIVTSNPTNFYKDNELIYSINEELTLPIIINDTDYYYVEFDDQLLGIKKDNVSKTVENKRNQDIAVNIGVLNYHFFYTKSIGQVCDQIICLDIAKFDEQMKYLKDEGFYTATMEDMALWMEKKIRLPKKTTVITIDDGAMGTDTLLPRTLEKYDLHGTLFLITAWWPKSRYQSPNMEIQSHGNNIHNYLGEALSKTKAELLDDFKKSIDALDGEHTAFCYPFYSHNATVRSAVKESGFKIAFAGGNVKANQNNDPYQINRYVIYDNITLDQFKNMVN